MVSLKDIAAELKISIGLISKVLNGRMGTTRVSPRIRNRILKKAEAMGYVPNRNAQALLSGRKGAIGIFITPWGEPGSEFIQLFLAGAASVLKDTPYHLWMDFIRHDSDFMEKMSMKDIRSRVDGIVVGGVPQPKMLPYLRELEKAGMPVVTFFEGMHIRQPVNIAVDNYLQGYRGTDHLLKQGCDVIAEICTSEERHRGFLAAMRDAKRKVDPLLVVKGLHFSIADGRAAARKLLQGRKRFEGIVAHSDGQAYGACMELMNRGVSVPDEVRIIGVDDSPMCLASPVPLSSVTSECAQVGALTMEAVLKKIAGEKVETHLVAPHVIARSSS